jgi:6-pyruvoyl-tetrahydropterin synthase
VFQVTDGIHIHFGHHVRGHMGPCISIHGHTWMFQVTLGARELDAQGFVIDFDILHERVLGTCHRLLDHSLALGEDSWRENAEALTLLGNKLYASRQTVHGASGERQPGLGSEPDALLAGARNEWPGNIKVAVFPFTPTSERLAEWLAKLAAGTLADERVKVVRARVIESLHPTESIADYFPE